MKVIILFTFLVAVHAGYLGLPAAHLAPAPVFRTHLAPAAIAPAPVIAKTVAVADAEYDPHPQYSYAYDIQDALTGDSKNHYETRNGDIVQGSYSLVESDGTRRIVEYTADPIHGFNAVVHKEPIAVKAIAAPVHAPLAYAAPYAKVAAPLLHANTFAH